MSSIPTAESMTHGIASGRTRSRQICGLDLIRFMAALLVVVHHLGFWVVSVVPATRSALLPLAPYTWSGWVGVEIFFVLSGFVIAYSAEHASSSSFVISRLVRLYPAAWICSSLTALVLYFGQPTAFKPRLWIGWLTTFTLWPRGPILDSVYWTLRVEMLFYALVLLILLTRSFRWIGQIMTVLGLLSTAGWAYTALLAGAMSSSKLGRGVSAFFRQDPFSDLYLARFAPFFAIGVLLWLCLFRGATPARVAAIVVCGVGCLFEMSFRAQWLLHRVPLTLPLLVPLMVWLASLGAIIASVKCNTRLTALLGPRGVAVSRTLGLMTYPLYLLHAGVGFVLIGALHGKVSDRVSVLLSISLSILASFLINRYLEGPLQSRLKQLLVRFATQPKLAPVVASSLP